MVNNHYRWDFIGLSTDTKPTPETSEKVANGSTFYCSDTSKLYVFYKDTWYERKALGGGGGGGTTYTAGDGIDITNDTISVDTTTIQPKLTAGSNITISDENVISASGGGSINPVQTTGTSTTDVMSQNAVTSMVFADAGTNRQIQIGDQASAPGTMAVGIGFNTDARTNSIAIGNQAKGGTSNAHTNGIAIGTTAKTQASGAISLGAYSQSTQQGEMNIGSSDTSYGYNSTNYRLLSGVHDPVNAHDAATKGYVDAQGGGVTPVQTTGTSTTDVMSQNAVSSMIFADPATATKVSIGNTNAGNDYAISIGNGAYGAGSSSVAIGHSSNTYGGQYGIAIGEAARARASGTIAIGYNANNGQSGGASSVAIGSNSHAGEESVAIGENAGYYSENNTVSIGRGARAYGRGSVAIGDQTAMPDTSVRGTVSIKAISNGYGYNGVSNYRLLTGLYDGQDANDAVNVGQVNATIDAINTALSTNIPHIGASS